MNEDINKLVGRIIASTKRKKRNLSIVEIADDIKILKDKTGGISEVAKLVGISTGMLNQFLSVFDLPLTVQELIKEKKIDSVAIVFTLSKFSKKDIELLTEQIIQGKLNSQELKALLPFRRQHPSENILDLVERIKKSQNVKVSIVRIPKKLLGKKEMLTEAIKAKVGEENVISIDENDETIEIALTKVGENKIREIAKENNVTLSQFIQRLLQYAR